MIDSVFCNDCCSHDFPTSTITILWHFVRRMMNHWCLLVGVTFGLEVGVTIVYLTNTQFIFLPNGRMNGKRRKAEANEKVSLNDAWKMVNNAEFTTYNLYTFVNSKKLEVKYVHKQ